MESKGAPRPPVERVRPGRGGALVQYPILAGLVAVIAVSAAVGGPVPLIPKDEIPPDMPPDVRKHVLSLYTGHDGDQIAAANALGAMGAQGGSAAPFLASMMRDQVRHGNVGWSAARALMRMGEAAIEPTILAMQFGGRYSRMRGLDVLRELKDPRTIPVLVTAIVDELSASGRDAREALRHIGQPAMDYLTDSVRSPNPELRRGAVLALSAFPRTNVVELVSTCLADKSPAVRDAARESLLRLFRDRNAVFPPLNKYMREALREADPRDRRAAIQIASYAGDDSKVDEIARLAVADPDREVRLTAIQTIGWIKSARAVDTLLGLPESPDAWVREAVAEALGRVQDPRAIPRLAALAADKNPLVREKAVSALGGFRSTEMIAILLAAIDDDDPLVRVSAARGLGNVRDARAIAPLKGALGDIDKGVRVESVVSLRLFYLGKARMPGHPERRLPANEAVPLYARVVQEGLLRALEDSTVMVRLQALEALTERGAPEVVGAVFRLVRDPDPTIQSRALDHLSRVKELPSLEPIREAARDGHYHTRERAVRLLGERKDRQSFEMIAARLADHRNMACAAVDGLKHFGVEAIEPMAGALRHKDRDVRRRAAEALMRMEHPKARELLVRALGDEDSNVRDAASYAFARAPHDARTPAILAAMVRQNIDGRDNRSGEELARLGPRAVPSAVLLLRDDDLRVRRTAADILGRIADRSAVSPLVSALRDTDAGVRRAALRALAAIGDPNAIPGIRTVLSDTNAGVRETAASALGRLVSTEAASALATMSTDPDWHMRSVAAHSLGGMKDDCAARSLSASLTDGHWYVRRSAAEALGRLGDRSAVPALAAVLEDEHWSVRSSALAALKAITAEDLGRKPEPWEAWWADEHREAGNQRGPKADEPAE